MTRPLILSFCSVVLSGALMADAQAVERIAGPVEVKVSRVIDGDTFRGEALVWPGHVVRVSVRLRGIDAPEMRGRCPGEKEAAEAARLALAALIGDTTALVSNISGDKYFGRVLPDVSNADGQDIASALLERDLVRPYGGARRNTAC